jgi:hypothetical protein
LQRRRLNQYLLRLLQLLQLLLATAFFGRRSEAKEAPFGFFGVLQLVVVVVIASSERVTQTPACIGRGIRVQNLGLLWAGSGRGW